MATRRERVVLDLETNFPVEAAKAAAAIALLNEEINHLGGKGSNRSPLKAAGKDIEDVGRKADRTAPSIDKLSGRVNLLAKGFAVLGPSLIPIGAVGIPALTGLASSFGFAAIAGGTAVLAFQGVGDALKAMNDAALEQTAEHLQKAQDAMNSISPAAQKFVQELRALQPELDRLQATAAAGILPGVTEGLQQMSGALPAVERIVGAVAGELGDIAASAGKSLGGDRWADFFSFLADEAPKALADMATGVGNVAHAMAELWMAFQPLNSSFSTWLVNSTADLDKWASGLSKTQGFQEFVDYINANGPQVGATMGAIANAVLQIVEAAAPLGGPVLKAIEGVANAIAAIADSDIGTPLFSMIAAFSALNLAMTAGSKVSQRFGGTFNSLQGQFTKQSGSLRSLAADWRAYTAVTNSAQGRAQASAGQIIAQREAQERLGKSFRETATQAGKASALVGAFALQSTGLGDKLGVSNTLMLGMAGSVIPGWGTAIGVAAGATLDLAHSTDNVTAAVTGMRAAMRTGDIDAMNNSLATFAKNAKDAYGFDLTSSSGPSLGKLLFGIGPQQGLNAAKDALTGKLQDAQKQSRDLNASLNADASDRAVESLVHSLGLLPPGFHLASSSAKQAAANLLAARTAAQKTGQSFVGLGDSVSDSKTSLNGWIQDMAKSASALRQFTANSLIAANRGLRSGLIQALQQAGPEGAKRMQQLADGTDSQIKRANRAWGAGKAAVRGYTDAIGGVPGSKSTKVSAPGTPQARAQIKAMRDEIARLKDKSVHMNESGSAAARARIAALRAAIASLRDRTVRIGINTVRTTSGSTAPGAGASARGNIFHYANGDIANGHQPELAGPGPTRMWREPETQGEAYIPLANDSRRGRARDIAAQTVAILGGNGDDIEWYASGGGKHPKHSAAHHPKHQTRKQRLNAELNEFNKALDKSTDAIDKERSARDDLVSRRNDLASSIGGSFLSDQFATSAASSDIWAAGASAGGKADPLGVLRQDTANAKQYQSLIVQLKKNGLSGQALASVDTLDKAKTLIGLGAAGDKQYQSLFNQRAAASSAAGMYTANSVYAAGIARDNATLKASLLEQKKLNQKIDQLEKAIKNAPKETGHAVSKGVNKAAAAGPKKKRGR